MCIHRPKYRQALLTKDEIFVVICLKCGSVWNSKHVPSDLLDRI